MPRAGAHWNWADCSLALRLSCAGLHRAQLAALLGWTLLSTRLSLPRGSSDWREGMASPYGKCDALLLPASLYTLLSQGDLDVWGDMGTPGVAPFEAHMDELAGFWDACKARGGRVWEVLAEEVPAGRAVCSPYHCSQQEVEERLWPQHLHRTSGSNASSGAAALELGHWRQLRLDFVLAGFEKCGTSSLSHNLARHPQVEFVPPPPEDPRINTDGQEAQDGHLFWHVGNRLLPPVALIHAFNEARCCAGGARVAGVSDGELHGRKSKQASGDGPHSRGERNPVYIFHRAIMKMVALVPGVRVILLACDPIAWLQSAYADKMNWYPEAEDLRSPPPPQLAEFAAADLVASPSGHWYNLSRRRALFTRFLESLTRMLGSSIRARLHLLHRDAVDDRRAGAAGMHAAYNRIAAFLRLDTFPRTFNFEKKNVHKKDATGQGGHSTLCKPSDAALRAGVQHYYKKEYARLPVWLARLGGLVPPSVAANRTVCDL